MIEILAFAALLFLTSSVSPQMVDDNMSSVCSQFDQ